MNIRDSIAIVTGANRGLGRCFVESLLERGAAKVYAGARNPDSLSELIEQYGERVVPLKLDVTSDEDVASAAHQATDATILINNAGILESRGIIEAGDLTSLQREMDVNVFGLARMSQAMAPALASNGGGAILNILSVASLVAFPPFGSYAASKAAAMSLTHSMRYELHGQGTMVHGLYAGFIDTGMIDYVDAEKTTPGAIVAAGLDGIESGTPDIDADDRAKDIRKALQENPEGLLQSSRERADEFRTAYPVKETK